MLELNRKLNRRNIQLNTMGVEANLQIDVDKYDVLDIRASSLGYDRIKTA